MSLLRSAVEYVPTGKGGAGKKKELQRNMLPRGPRTDFTTKNPQYVRGERRLRSGKEIKEKILMQNVAIALHVHFTQTNAEYRKIATAISEKNWQPNPPYQDLPLCEMGITPPINRRMPTFHISALVGTKKWMKNSDNEYHPSLVRSILLYVYPATLRRTRCHLICSIWNTGVQTLYQFAPINPLNEETLVNAYTSNSVSDRKSWFLRFFPNFLTKLEQIIDKDKSMQSIMLPPRG